LTSHGTRQGFVLRGQPVLTPERLSDMIDAACGEQPTVVLVSACFSGTFVHDAMRRPNRVILTAARDDVTSFGCSPESEFTYWDGCLIDTLPRVDTWRELADGVAACIEDKESRRRYP